jgi:hypothetical protein
MKTKHESHGDGIPKKTSPQPPPHARTHEKNWKVSQDQQKRGGVGGGRMRKTQKNVNGAVGRGGGANNNSKCGSTAPTPRYNGAPMTHAPTYTHIKGEGSTERRGYTGEHPHLHHRLLSTQQKKREIKYRMCLSLFLLVLFALYFEERERERA